MTLLHRAQPDFISSGITDATVAAPQPPFPARLRVVHPDVGIVELIAIASSLSETDDAESIIELYDLWLRHHPLNPQRFGVHFNAGTLLNQMGRHTDALTALEEAIRLAPGFLAAYVNAGVALEGLGRLQEAAAHWLHVTHCSAPLDDSIIALKIIALRHLARTFESAKDYARAEIAYRQCLEIGPHQNDVIEHWVLMRQLQCKWPSIEPCANLTRSEVVAVLSPLPLAIITGDPLFQLANAARYFEQDVMAPLASQAAVSWIPPAPPKIRKQRLRIGYVSPDLRGHAIGFLTAELFGLHDRARVEVFAYYSGLPTPDATQLRIRQTVDHWTDIAGWNAEKVAQRIADDRIDILIDLGGHTSGAPAPMFALRPAPVIVNWLGYPGSMGTPHHQYIIADDTIIPPEHEKYYSERVMRLPCYQPTDRQRIVARQPSRHEVGLPDGVVVYCCFNGPQKITSAMFRCWMTILARVPHAVLWLLSNDAPTEERLRQQAVCHGIVPERIIFARRMANADHMARYPFADLFLDTSPYGAHTTASDALWMGVPVLTIAGLSFASRVCASLVTSAGLPDLVCDNADAYIDRAVECGTHPDLLSTLKQKLRATRDCCTLFDMKRLVTRLEALYAQMWDDYVSDRIPEPDLTNLAIYHAIGAAFDHDAAEALNQPSYERKYAAALAARHVVAPIPADRRLWHEPLCQTANIEDSAPPDRQALTGARSMVERPLALQPNPRMMPMDNITEIATQERCDLTGHVYDAFLLAMSETSELDPKALSIRGMSGKKYRRFVNNIVRLLKDTTYLEVGSWAGSTLCSAINRNNVRATAIDNWSQFGGPKNEFLANLATFQTPKAYVNFIEEDFRKVDYSSLGEFTVYLFDGPHEYQDQFDGLRLALPALASQFVFIVDDWNWSPVRNGTMRAISETGTKLDYAIEIRTTFDNSHPAISGESSDWHNGYFISVLSKP